MTNATSSLPGALSNGHVNPRAVPSYALAWCSIGALVRAKFVNRFPRVLTEKTSFGFFACFLELPGFLFLRTSVLGGGFGATTYCSVPHRPKQISFEVRVVVVILHAPTSAFLLPFSPLAALKQGVFWYSYTTTAITHQSIRCSWCTTRSARAGEFPQLCPHK